MLEWAVNWAVKLTVLTNFSIYLATSEECISFACTVYRSFRNTENGSWYINALVRVFMEDACQLDVCAMLNKVSVSMHATESCRAVPEYCHFFETNSSLSVFWLGICVLKICCTTVWMFLKAFGILHYLCWHEKWEKNKRMYLHCVWENGHLFWVTICKTVHPMLSDRCPVCL